MLWRPLAGIAILVAMLFAVASATSLGTFDDVALSAEAEPVTACAVTETNFYSEGLLGSLTELALSLLSTSEVDYIGLEGLSGDCRDDLRPVVVVTGDGLLSEPAVLSRTLLARLGEDPSSESEVFLQVPDGDELNLLDPSLTATGVRVAFCPDGIGSCEP